MFSKAKEGTIYTDYYICGDDCKSSQANIRGYMNYNVGIQIQEMGVV